MPGLHLTKSRYIVGLQCLRRLWLQVHEPSVREDPAPGSPLDVGQAVGRKARLLFPDGVLVDEPPWQHADAVRRTAELMADPTVPAIFEAAFEHDGVRVRVDVLERLGPGSWGLREVKSDATVKKHHADDLALQAFVLAGAGVAVTSIELVHVNKGYVRGPDGICWPAFFVRTDATSAVKVALAKLPSRLRAMQDCLSSPVNPDAEPGGQCRKPYECEFRDRCMANKPADWVGHLPRVSGAKVNKLRTLGIEAISAIPADFPLTAKQAIIRNVAVSGQPYIAPNLARLLGGREASACYLDFETMKPVIPLYPGTRAHQVVPFQWSLHAIDANGTLHHREFIAAGDEDPRRPVAETLITALAQFAGPILVYSSYERIMLKELAEQFPDLRSALMAITGRLLDLLSIVRDAVYLPAFRFSYSLKSVAPALVPGFSYGDLDGIAAGGAATAAFERLASGAVTIAADVARLRAALLAYCERDTLAMVEAHRALLRFTA